MARFLACTPGGYVTGGIELQHQLVRTLCDLGHDARICYYPFDRSFECPEPYKHYGVSQAPPTDDPDVTVVIPEVSTRLTEFFPRSRKIIWWMSVDNYFGRKKESDIKDLYMRFRTLLSDRILLSRLRHFEHIVQSEYALKFLKRAGIRSQRVSDYLGADHLVHREFGEREDVILFNPKKGLKKTQKLMTRYPQFRFLPLQNMTPAELSGWFSRAKIYMDFGQHPGKDRMPREAAMAGCCVITGRDGSAAFYEDVPIPDTYKLDDRGSRFVDQFGPLTNSIFADFDGHLHDFDHYRTMIRAEPGLFREQVASAFGRGETVLQPGTMTA
jgi:hypothetical protein